MKENKLINKGFTLIELIAVIVILAIIALIATPVVLNIISDSKQKAKNDSVNAIIDAVNLYQLQYGLSMPATITFDNEGVASTGGTVIDLGLSGDKPTGGRVLIDSQGKILAQGITFSDGYICTMASGENGCMKAEITGGTVTSTPAIEYITSKNNDISLTTDPSDATRKIFKGANPNNYINLKENNDDVLYRIVSIESDGAIKVVRDERETPDRPFDQTDTVGSTAPSGPRDNENNTYCQKEGSTYAGCNAWAAVEGTFINGSKTGTVKQNASLNTYLNGEFYNKLDNNVKSKILTYTFDVGGIGFLSSLSSAITQSKANTWQGKIGLINYMDWFNASSYASCDATQDNNYCSNENYLYKRGYWWWTLSPKVSYSYHAFFVSNDVYGVYFNSTIACTSGGVRPTFYLTSNINLTGEGTSGSPFEIS